MVSYHNMHMQDCFARIITFRFHPPRKTLMITHSVNPLLPYLAAYIKSLTIDNSHALSSAGSPSH